MSRTSTGFYPWNNRTQNTLLLKDDVGRSKPSAYSLPPVDYTYGRPLERDEEGAKEVSMTWKYHAETRPKEPDRDFAKLNKMSLTQGLHKSNQFSDYRKRVDARMKVVKGRNALPLYIPEEEFRYGLPNRPSTPIKLVLGNCYGLEFQQRIEQDYMYRSQQDSFKPRLLPKGNKASDLSYTYTKQKLSQIQQNNNKELFKLTKFKKVQPRTNTYLHKNVTDVGKTSEIPNHEEHQHYDANEVPNQAVE
ncbi:hypothetical protein TTHERM_00974270 (macronuclear) [Tetrahymena thermophila SB210]|uniref:Uncharacterized protein n=1 Tax=Tetrahymena thermophila (strain SB210) TaxID=312017 RepID=Q22WR6_TETTS|nr:hypothetical protein TTHERM_00974270 [Tetrahymena thermophila SB210]8G2Z_5E Chain 5E, CFAP77A [Tetrahymena thermophila CU428]8G2Z_5F Chain 5F, CFAP77A [Tetrahymena thermophila CU428]8G2Z_5G Chain 5G, CFAP77A [Tetrahymena thermophila CU428]8G2Z_5H Chain 5H, CFAP77A [Tetrahymena thermophila CU428]8G3D_5E Chain 5E, CFAP77A [Tetrahymena thermophila]8G3D_5F Chain 5F, CFAP77A [Tetrahymena thermophila]8G3D_5G Chain 5G, CFAP77A [Tetrahymena thermophila]8G3D_5H Chain 5H, CFAP77A [Tetrahymena ther|eukprot:XP_001009971.2 hypothetical protein TTHERM_00974270 [Tetrahymena thermophila SB210]